MLKLLLILILTFAVIRFLFRALLFGFVRNVAKKHQSSNKQANKPTNFDDIEDAEYEELPTKENSRDKQHDI